MPTTERQERALAPLRPESTPESRPDRLILVYEGDSMLCRRSIGALESKLVAALSIGTGGER
jgi:hypothetical protein